MLLFHSLYAGFNPRARDGRERARYSFAELSRCFNPRARDGREKGVGSAVAVFFVSIHAPVMDAKQWFIDTELVEMFQSTRP